MKKHEKEASEDDDEPNTKVEWQEELLDDILKMSHQDLKGWYKGSCANQVSFKLKLPVNQATVV
jgi:hypothetical protein